MTVIFQELKNKKVIIMTKTIFEKKIKTLQTTISKIEDDLEKLDFENNENYVYYLEAHLEEVQDELAIMEGDFIRNFPQIDFDFPF